MEKKRLRPKNSEVLILHGSNKKIKKTLRWKPKFSFETGLSETIEWFKKKENLNKFNNTNYNI